MRLQPRARRVNGYRSRRERKGSCHCDRGGRGASARGRQWHTRELDGRARHDVRVLEPVSFEHDLGNLLRAQCTVLECMQDGAGGHEQLVVEVVALDPSLHDGRREPQIVRQELPRVATLLRVGIGHVGFDERERGNASHGRFGARGSVTGRGVGGNRVRLVVVVGLFRPASRRRDGRISLVCSGGLT